MVLMDPLRPITLPLEINFIQFFNLPFFQF